MPVKPPAPRWQSSHPLARGHVAAWFFAEGGGTTVADSNSAGGIVGNNLTVPRPCPGTLAGAGATWTGSADGRAVLLDGATGYMNCGTGCDLGGAGAMSAWARFIIVANKADGTYAGILTQWNDPVASNTFYQRFALQLVNNAFGRPANTLEFSLYTSNSAYINAGVQFTAADVGRVLTLVGTYDGTTARVYGTLGGGLATAATAGSPGTVGTVTGGSSFQTNTIWGREDGNYLNMIALAGGLLKNRVLTAADVLALHANPYSLIATPPKRAFGPSLAAAAWFRRNLYDRAGSRGVA